MKRIIYILIFVLLFFLVSCNKNELTINEEKELLDNILISVPIWRDMWVNEEHFNLLLDAQVDMVVAVTGLENATFATSRNMLDIANKTKREEQMIKVLIHSNVMTDEILNYSDKEIELLLEEFKGNETLAGYHIVDEPYNPNPFVRVEKLIKAYDPDRLTDLNFLPGMVYESYDEFFAVMDDYLKLLGDSTSYLSFDNYPFTSTFGSVNESQLFGNFEAVRRAGLENDVPTAFYIQAVGGYGSSYRRPDEGTLRYHASSALAYGFKWIKYWSWFVPDYGNPEETYKDYTDAIIGKDGKPTQMYDLVVDMHKEIKTVGSTLAKLDSLEVYHTGSRSRDSSYNKIPDDYFVKVDNNEYAIVSLFKHRANGDYYLMIVNKDMANKKDFSFSLTNVDSVYELSKSEEGKLKKLSNKKLSFSLNAGDFILFKIAGDIYEEKKDDSNLLANALIKASDSASGDGWFISNLFDGIKYSSSQSQGYRLASEGENYLEFKFDDKETFNRLTIYPAGTSDNIGKRFPDNFKLYYSNDGKSWKVLFEGKDIEKPTDIIPSFSFERTSAKFVKIVFNLKKGQGLEIAELVLFDDEGEYVKETITNIKIKPSFDI